MGHPAIRALSVDAFRGVGRIWFSSLLALVVLLSCVMVHSVAQAAQEYPAAKVASRAYVPDHDERRSPVESWNCGHTSDASRVGELDVLEPQETEDPAWPEPLDVAGFRAGLLMPLRCARQVPPIQAETYRAQFLLFSLLPRGPPSICC